jgi:PAS domain S-box-containing protein
MQKPGIPVDEDARIEALRSYAILDTPPAPSFDRLTRLAAHLFDVPVALVSLIDSERQWFKSRVGIDVCETSREVSLCAHAILNNTLFVVPDAAADPRFADNPFVAGEFHLRFYAGAPLRSREGRNLGTLCLIGLEPRPDLTPVERQLLRDLADLVTEALEAHRDFCERLDSEAEARHQHLSIATSVLEHCPVAVIEITPDGMVSFWNAAAEAMFGWKAGETLGRFLPILRPDDRQEHVAMLKLLINGQAAHRHLSVRRDRNGSLHPVNITAVRRDQNDVFGGVVLFIERADAG